VDHIGGQQYLVIDIDRSAIARYGLNASDVNDTIEMAIAGKSATEIYEGERRFQAIVRLPASYRSNIDDIKQISVLSPNGPRVPLSDLANIQVIAGPAQINRDMAKRRIVVGINVQGRDLGGYVADLQQAVNQKVDLPPGYFVQWGGQFQNMQRALHHLAIVVIGGLITSTLLTLIIIPCLYAIFEGKQDVIEDQEMEHHLVS
jgi:cobalt-zinc-cadmium resistance protein CzcA